MAMADMGVESGSISSPASSRRKLFIRTYGCQMNVYDSGRMADILHGQGFDSVDAPEQADLVILNTCHIREKASDKVFSELGRLRQLKQERADRGQALMIVVAGCVAQAEGAELRSRAPFVDLVLGPQSYHRLGDLMNRLDQNNGRSRTIIETDFPPESKFDHLPPTGARDFSAFVSIQEGCDRFCSFCVVPYTRGAAFSRPANDITDEIRTLLALGTREITLIGQNVNAYRGRAPDGEEIWGLGALLRHLTGTLDLHRLRFTTSHPLDMDDDLIQCFADLPALMPYLHLPLQSGSDSILAAMNRRHTVAEYREMVDRLRRVRPDLALSGDFIVGFPGETDGDFAATRRLVKEIGYAQAYSFKYSARPGTPAATLPHPVPETVKAARLAELQADLASQQLAFNRAQIGQTQSVLLEQAGRRPGQLTGRGPYMQAVQVYAPESLLGKPVPVRITQAHPNSLDGRLLPTVPGTPPEGVYDLPATGLRDP